MKTTPGTLEITTTHIYFWETLELRPKEELHKAPKDRKWRLDQLREIHQRRYLLRRSSLEFFLVDQTNAFFNFKRDRSKVFSKLVDLRPPNLIYSETGTAEEIFKRSGLTKKWQLGQISNFDYLMQINTIAGRTYNDLSQYPVFPWVLSNFSSEEIDLRDPRNYRDLSRPIGALNPERLKEYLKRYSDMKGGEMGVPPFHYGSHYSNSGTVVFYLLRVEPFTSLFIDLQSGKFDIADRLFHNIEDTWNNCLTNPSDVKELIPEFFYFPEFLTNSNKFYFGKTKGGIGAQVDDVILPKWAPTPRDFVTKMREALEGDVVSSTLHQWIDLIFGFKQQGKEAIEAVNVFYYLTYEGSVDLDAITDDHSRNAYESQIHHFGQTPTQLMKQKHPPREVKNSNIRTLFSKTLRTTTRSVEISKNPLMFMAWVPYSLNPSFLSSPNLLQLESSKVVTIDKLRNPGCHRWVAGSSSSSSSSSLSFSHLPTGSSSSISNSECKVGGLEVDPLVGQKRRIGTPFAADIVVTNALFAVTEDGKTVVSCGHWDNSFKVTSIDGKLIQSVAWHKDLITCLSMGRDGKSLLTGSRDTTLALWTFQMRGNSWKVAERPTRILHGHNDEVTCVCISVELDIAISGGKDGRCVIHSLRKGTYVRSMKPTNHAVSLVCIGGDKIATYTAADFTVRLFGLNGTFLSSFHSNERLTTLNLTKEGRFLVLGGGQGTLSARLSDTCETVYRHNCDSAVCCVEMTQDCLTMLVGLQNGKLMTITAEG